MDTMAQQLKTIAPIWVFALVGAIVIGLAVPRQDWLQALPIVMVLAVLATFCVQLAVAEKVGFVDRVMASLAGSIVILAAATLVLGLLSTLSA
ncbi:MAG: hypothetical protein RI885_1430 [Actinomycetota bacterium]|jgi:hypothetical protein